MCLSRVVHLDQVDAERARGFGRVDGRTVSVSLAVLALQGDLPESGDWVQETTGLAVRRLTEAEATRILAERHALNGGS